MSKFLSPSHFTIAGSRWSMKRLDLVSNLEKFEHLLNEYYHTDRPQTNGLPSVAWCANELNLSAGYFGDLIKRETGKTAQDYIQEKIIDVAKGRIFDHNKSVGQIAYELGFKYPQHFTRLFKQRVKCCRRMSTGCLTKYSIRPISCYPFLLAGSASDEKYIHQ